MRLDGIHLHFVEVVDYLGLLLSREGFKGKDRENFLSKCMGALQMLINEPCFTLALHPKHISRGYQTYVSRIMLYGVELLSHANRQQIYDLDDKLINTMFERLLKLGRGRLSNKHLWRIRLAIGLPTLRMDLDALISGRVDTWL